MQLCYVIPSGWGPASPRLMTWLIAAVLSRWHQVGWRAQVGRMLSSRGGFGSL